MTAARSHFIARLSLAALVFAPGPVVRADGPRAESHPPLSRFVPAEAGVFVEFRRLDRLQEQLRSLNAWRLIELLTTSPDAADRSSGDRTLDWADVVSSNLGMPADEVFARLFAGQAALAAEDWQRLRYGVILLRPPDPAAIDRLTAPDQVLDTVQRSERVTLYQTRRGLWVATDGRVVVLSQQSETTDFYRKAIALLDGANEPSLAGSPGYVGQLRQLGPECAGHVYFAKPTGAGGGEYWPSLRWGIVGVYVREQRVDFVIRARLDRVREQIYRPPVDVDRLMRLPRSTLWTWGTSVSWSSVRQRLSPGAGWPAPLGEALPVGPEALSGLLARLGPRVIVVWGQGERGSDDFPQVAVLLESPEAATTARTLDEAVATFLSGAAADRGDSPSARLQQVEHLGTTVSSLTFPTSRPATDASRLDTFRDRLQPSYAPLDGWLVLGLHADHVRAIIDAERGRIPRLGDTREVASTVHHRSRSATLSLCQPALCSQIIRGWLRDFATNPNSFWRTVLADAGRPRRSLGIGMSLRQQPGRVTVSRVYPDTPAHGRLRPGDEILAIDGHVLALDRPNADLRRYVEAQPDGRPFVLRVQREEELTDVAITLTPPPPPQPGPAEVLERLARLGDDLPYAAFVVSASRPDRYVARLTLGFSAASAAPASPASQPTTAPAAR
jgi:hypothetical protein